MLAISPFFVDKNILFPKFYRYIFCKLQESIYLCKKFKEDK